MKQTFRVLIGCALALNLMSCGGGGGGSSSNSSGGSTSTCSAGSSANTGSSAITTLGIHDVVTGTGPVAAAGQTVTVNYSAWLYNVNDPNNEGTEFADVASDGSPYTFQLGSSTFIAGWNQGIEGMQAGGTRIITMPSSLAYGSCPIPTSPIPPDSALVFQVQLVSIQ